MTGFKLSLIGAALFFLGLFLLLVLPVGAPIAAILIGGMLVWSGFIWTIFGGYVKPSPPSPPES